mgnify:CR=1 FL=1
MVRVPLGGGVDQPRQDAVADSGGANIHLFPERLDLGVRLDLDDAASIAAAAKAIEEYQNEFRFHYPHEHRAAGRPARRAAASLSIPRELKRSAKALSLTVVAGP